ncbi:class I SAM-dependent methyltransferase [Paenibacillus sp. MBLB2552]|uniref:Class I SAM-dependent methyltransferase n=1 Tax=Paenibacillus mellifer TaxID=2937794 RepID=A0A9X2BNU2_9BACL|nr:class I SAM-dependent methyltransferase [Paenibacillus mellifer]MCK8486453.1 class I SAM-dependent methyltransferase [Paenibacillus mellifer]
MPASAIPILPAVLLIFLLIAAVMIVYRSWRNGISPMPASAVVRRAVVRELMHLKRTAAPKGAASLFPARPVVEAGSGWGTLALAIAGADPGLPIVGIENSMIPWLYSRIALRMGDHPQVQFLRGDLYKFPYETAGMVICYLYPEAMRRLDPLLRAQLTPGARVISVCFALPGWQPVKVVTCQDLYRTKIYIYEKD